MSDRYLTTTELEQRLRMNERLDPVRARRIQATTGNVTLSRSEFDSLLAGERARLADAWDDGYEAATWPTVTGRRPLNPYRAAVVADPADTTR